MLSGTMSEDILDKQFLMRQVVTIGFGLVAMYLTRKLLNGMIEEMEGRKKVKSIVYEVPNKAFRCLLY